MGYFNGRFFVSATEIDTGAVPVETELDETSVNPIANGAVAAHIHDMESAFNITERVNLINPAELEFDEDSGTALTGDIPVSPGDEYTYQITKDGVRAKEAFSCKLYDAKRNYVEEVNADDVLLVVDIPEGVAYARFRIGAYDIEPAIVKSLAIVDYEPYIENTHILKPESLPEGIGNGSAEGAVLYTEQELTEEQKAQARENIGAGTADETDPYNDYQPDVPENIGVLNAILNAKQLAEIPITPLASMPQKAGDWAAGKTKYGLPYSSSRVEEGFVPNFVSLYTFMTALRNPNSYLYTVDLGEAYNNQNGTTYYGTVCSVFCAYALNIVPNYTTHQWQDVPGMEYVPWQSVYALKLGDTICHHTSGHVVMVTDITRNKRGKIGKITITEAATVKVKVTEYTPEELAAAFPTEDYAFHRYSKINEVQHIQSPFVAVEDETPLEFTYNTALIPRKGDKANWLQGVPVEIDLLAKSGYNAVEVYKDETTYDTVTIESGEEQPVDRTVYGLGWTSTTLSGGGATKSITTQFISSMNIDITVADGVKVRVGFYNADQSIIDGATSDWISSGTLSVSDIAPSTAKLCKINASFNDESEISDIDSVASMITVTVPSDVDVMPLVLVSGGLSSTTGDVANNNARLRTDFLPLQNVQLTGSENVQYYIYYYDADKTYLSNGGAWMNGTLNVMDGVPNGTAYFRLVVKNTEGSNIYSDGGTYSLEITLTVFGGATEGDTDYIVLNDLEYGSYKARLTNGTNHSDWCYWIVVDAVSTAVSSGEGTRKATVTFSASNAEPLFIKWAGGVDNGTKHINVLTAEEKTAGTATVKYETALNDGQNDTYKMRVAFQTEYGIIHTPLPEAITV